MMLQHCLSAQADVCLAKRPRLTLGLA